MDRKEFQKLAVRTESLVPEAKTTERDFEYFTNALSIYEAATNVLDAYKKHFFYKEKDGSPKRIDHDYVMNQFKEIDCLLDSVACAENDETTNRGFIVPLDVRIFHALLGTITEHGEIASALLKGFSSGELDIVNVCEELGDSDWYKALFYEATGIEWVNVQSMIIKKLEIRYADKIFTEAEASQRDLQAERKVLEDSIKEAVDEYKNRETGSRN